MDAILQQCGHICFSAQVPMINIRLAGDGGSVRGV